MRKLSYRSFSTTVASFSTIIGLLMFTGAPAAYADAANASYVYPISAATWQCSGSMGAITVTNVTAGDLIYIGIGAKTTTLASAPTDNQSNTYSYVQSASAGTATARSITVYSAVASSTASYMYITVPCDGAYMAVAGEVVHPATGTSATVDASGTTSWTNASTGTATTSSSTTAANDLVMPFAYTREGNLMGSPSGIRWFRAYNNTSGTSLGGDNMGQNYTSWASGTTPSITVNTFDDRVGDGTTPENTWGVMVVLAIKVQ